MLIECKNCGAPLDVSPQESISKCQYCGLKNRVRETRTLAQVTPPQWQPPPVWQSPAQFGQSQQYTYHRPRPVAALVAVGVGLVMMPVVVVAVWSAFNASSAPDRSKRVQRDSAGDADDSAASDKSAPEWDGKSTIDCDGRSEVTVKGVDVDFGGADIAYISNNCVLRIIDSKLRGKGGLSFAGFHGEIEVTNSEITVEKGTAVFGFGRVKIEGSKISGDYGIAINLGGKVEVIKSEVAARKGTAIAKFSSVVVEASQLRGETGIELGLHAELTIKGGTIEAKGTAIQGGSAGDISCSGATIRGATAVDISMVSKQRKYDIAACTTHGKVNQPMRTER